MKETALNTDLLRGRVDALPADALAATRRHAIADFERFGLPTTRHEDWKYTSVAEAIEISNAWLAGEIGDGPLRPDLSNLDSVAEKIDAYWLVLRNGVVDDATLDQVRRAVNGAITISRLLHEDEAPELTYDDGFTSLNAALLRDGLRIVVPAGASLDKPIGILAIDDAAGRVSQSRTIIEIAADARLQIVECATSSGSERQFTNGVTDVSIGESGKLDFVRIQQRDTLHTGVNKFSTRLARDASLSHANFDFGGNLTRNDIIADIVEPGANVDLLGLYLASGRQHIDNHTTVQHRVGPATSNEEYRGILNGHSRCVFNGKAHVFAGADGTDANQSNHNLLLSERAEIDTKPELEIYADDVKCSHGATVGQLDEKALFYLRSRGLDERSARQLLTRAFAAGTLSLLAIDACRDYLDAALDERLASLLGDTNES